MNLSKKKNLAAKVLGVGKGRVIFAKSRIGEIKEAITKQDIRDLMSTGAISIREIKGRRKAKSGSRRVGAGNLRKNVNKRKRNYITMTRKLRSHIAYSRSQGKISEEAYTDLRKKIRNKFFKDKAHLREHIGGAKK